MCLAGVIVHFNVNGNNKFEIMQIFCRGETTELFNYVSHEMKLNMFSLLKDTILLS